VGGGGGYIEMSTIMSRVEGNDLVNVEMPEYCGDDDKKEYVTSITSGPISNDLKVMEGGGGE